MLDLSNSASTLDTDCLVVGSGGGGGGGGRGMAVQFSMFN